MLIKFGQQERNRDGGDEDNLLVSRSSLSPLAMLLLGEARGEGEKGMEAVAASLRERFERAREDRKNLSLPQVIFAPNQYESLLRQKKREQLKNLKREKPDLWQRARQIGKKVFREDYNNPRLEGYTHFLNPRTMQQRGGLPRWARVYRQHNPTVDIGNHRFYKPPAGEPMITGQRSRVPKQWRTPKDQKTRSQPSSPEQYRTYTVQEGDTLSGIGNRFGVDWHNIQGYGENPDVLQPGQELKVPR